MKKRHSSANSRKLATKISQEKRFIFVVHLENYTYAKCKTKSNINKLYKKRKIHHATSAIRSCDFNFMTLTTLTRCYQEQTTVFLRFFKTNALYVLIYLNSSVYDKRWSNKTDNPLAQNTPIQSIIVRVQLQGICNNHHCAKQLQTHKIFDKLKKLFFFTH